MENMEAQFSNLTLSDNITEYTCPICLGLTVEPVVTQCKHVFCYSCLNELMEMSPNETLFKCPMCREVFEKDFEMKINTSLAEALKKKFPEDYQKKLDVLIELKKTEDSFIKMKILYGNAHEEVENPRKSKNGQYVCNHKWTAFVRIAGEKEPQKYIKKVFFKLHESFPQNEITLAKPPYEICRIGWGYFEIPMTVYWKTSLKLQPLELSHTLNFSGKGETKVQIVKIPKPTVETKAIPKTTKIVQKK